MIKFLSIVGNILLENDNNLYLLCTGLSKNIEDFTNEPHLSFFVRSEVVEMPNLNLHDIAYEYQHLLSIGQVEAVNLAKITKGYAYGYQVLGEVYYKKEKDDDIEDLLIKFDRIVGSQYDLIWNSLSIGEQELVKIIVNEDSGRVGDIQAKMSNPKSFASYRDRLIKKHILNTEMRGYVNINLPRFREYVQLWKERNIV